MKVSKLPVPLYGRSGDGVRVAKQTLQASGLGDWLDECLKVFKLHDRYTLGLSSSHRWLLLGELWRRDVTLLYRGTSLGTIWFLVQPFLFLSIYSFVFLGVFQLRWPGESGSAYFVLQIFTGLSLHSAFAEILVKSPVLVQSEVNLVKKLKLPLDVLPMVPVLVVLVPLSINLVIIGLAAAYLYGPAIKVLVLPFLLLPFVGWLAVAAYLISAVGVYFRDLKVAMGFVATALLFLSPIFFPLAKMPPIAQAISQLNPLVYPMVQLRALLFEGRLPDPVGLFIYTGSAILALYLAVVFYKKLERGFADVL